MSATPWYSRVVTIFIATIISPLIGLVLLWLRTQTKVLWRVVLSIPILLFGVVHLAATLTFLTMYGFIEPSGDVLDFDFYIKRGGTESHYSAIDESRAENSVSVAQASEANDLQSTYWINFWGPNFDGKYDQTPVRTNVDEQPWDIVWKQPIGGGYASFVIAKGVAYTIEQRREEEVVTAYDITNGNELWNYAWDAFFQEAMGGDGPRATPVWDDDKIYALGANGHFMCLNAETGDLIWDTNILEQHDANNIMWGMSASPLVIGDLVIAIPGGRSDSMMVAYDKLTGEQRWSAFNDTIKYSSPFKATILGVEQIVFTSQDRVMGVSPEDGALIWEYRYEKKSGIDHKIGQPIVVGEDQIFVSSGYGYGCDFFKVIQDGDGFKTEQIWKNRNMKNRFSSPIFWEDHFYGLDESVLVCLDMEGKRKWKGGRYGHGQIVMAGGHIIVLSEQGDITLVEATPEKHNEIASMDVIAGKTWNFPALSDGYLMVRNANEMACLVINE